MRFLFLSIICLLAHKGFSQDSAILKVHFLYGSKPVRQYRHVEKRWFGGILGGHVGIECDSNQVINFVPISNFHVFAKQQNRHSAYVVHSVRNFYSIMGSNADSVKMAVVYIPIDHKQKLLFDSISTCYLQQTPYDYAFIGMRCGAAAYDILSQLHILHRYSLNAIYKKIFYPKKLRERLFRKAAANRWLIVKREGSKRRKWEQD